MKNDKIKKVLAFVLKAVAVACGVLGFFVIYSAVGTSDYETMVTKEIVHSTGDIVAMVVFGFSIMCTSIAVYNLGNLIYKKEKEEEEDLYDFL